MSMPAQKWSPRRVRKNGCLALHRRRPRGHRAANSSIALCRPRCFFSRPAQTRAAPLPCCSVRTAPHTRPLGLLAGSASLLCPRAATSLVPQPAQAFARSTAQRGGGRRPSESWAPVRSRRPSESKVNHQSPSSPRLAERPRHLFAASRPTELLPSGLQHLQVVVCRDRAGCEHGVDADPVTPPFDGDDSSSRITPRSFRIGRRRDEGRSRSRPCRESKTTDPPPIGDPRLPTRSW